jgi:hypothetical protein
MQIPDSEIGQFTEMLDNFILGNLPIKKMAALKGSITRKLNLWGKKYGVVDARSAALNIVQFLRLANLDNQRLNLWLNRLTVGSFYNEGDRTFGWYDPSLQVQAEQLPVIWDSKGIRVNFYGHHLEQLFWESRGFLEPVRLPWARYEQELEVNFNNYYKKPKKWAWYWACWGYAIAQPLPYTVYEDRLEVDRNFKDFGWWNGYKWWVGCQTWYKDKHPEWFDQLE